ncbi:HEPN domain-containing protein [Streptomyces virginiae]|uniref:HEPN domain-containing protein n=1 Tax=Streptomyces virginiae TaxID=1961 RepID=UPI00131AC7EE|nr:HEPN domain-containing protein [Streptomyces virginiae]MCX4719882.1 HEPN domain-containing protein [Streptomyces virginiae]MCX5271830.1 HEPN domain-containing protein [Streptomyces virginiae]
MDLVRGFFGDALTAYCLNIPMGELDATVLSQAQSSIVAEMGGFARSLMQNPDELFQRISMSSILHYDEPSQMSTPNAFRQQCGGEIVAKSSVDPVESALFALARETYPACLMPPRSSKAAYGHSEASTSVYRNPACRDAVVAVLNDPSLGRLFPDRAPSSESSSGTEIGAGTTSGVIWSNGSGGTLQLIGVITGILEYAARRISTAPSPEEYFSLVAEALKTTRTLAEKKPATVLTLVGLKNVIMTGKEPITFQGGQLRHPTTGDLEDLMGQEGIASVLEVRSPLQLIGIRPADTDDETMSADYEKFRPTFEKNAAATRRHIDLARLSILFASEGSPAAAPVDIATATLNPISSGRQVGISIYGSMPNMAAPITISEEIGGQIQYWSRRVAKHPSNLDMGMRRLLSAVSSRFDPMDAFVDAVICWENMFGTNQGEVGFRVAGSMAHLLQRGDPVARNELFSEIKNLYAVRSKLVHGAKEPSIQDAYRHRDRSIEIAISALKGLYDSPGLLTVDSAARGNKLLIGS